MDYDCTVDVQYESDEEYRRCLLAVFRLDSFDGIVSKVVALSQAILVKDKESVKELREAASQLGGDISSDLHFFMLFNYHDFKKTHEMLKKIIAV